MCSSITQVVNVEIAEDQAQALRDPTRNAQGFEQQGMADFSLTAALELSVLGFRPRSLFRPESCAGMQEMSQGHVIGWLQTLSLFLQ